MPLVVPNPQEQLQNINATSQATGDYYIRCNMVEQRFNKQIQLLAGADHKRAARRLEHEVYYENEHVAAQVDDQRRLAHDNTRDVVEKDERNDLRVDELLGKAEVGPVLVDELLEEVPGERDRLVRAVEDLAGVVEVMLADEQLVCGGRSCGGLFAQAVLDQAPELECDVESDETEDGVEEEFLVHDVVDEEGLLNGVEVGGVQVAELLGPGLGFA